MLGKGLESLIPPQKGGNQNQQGGDEHAGPLSAPHADFTLKEIEAPVPVPALPAEPPAANAPVTPPPPPAPPLRNAPPDKSAFEGERIFHLEVEKITPNPNQPRRVFDEEALRELAYSIREFGFIQPLVVSKIEKETAAGVEVGYQLIAGERRLLAAKMLGLALVPAIVKNVALEREKLELAVIENIQRENLNPIEVARSFQRLQEEFRLTQREIAAKLGKSRETVANTVRLLDLPPYIQEALEKGQISESHGRLLLAIDDPGAQQRLFDDLIHSRLTTRELKERVHAMKPERARRDGSASPEMKMFEEKLSMQLGTPVKIERGANTGKIMITFYSDEELKNIIDKVAGPEE